MRISQKSKINVFHKLFIKIKEFILILLNNLGINELFRQINKNKLIILNYHGINDQENCINPYFISKSTFLKQMIYLKKKKYKFITLTDWINIIVNKEKIKHRHIILTFDDGFESVIKNAYPIMKKLDIKGHFYIVLDCIGDKQIIWKDFIDLFIRGYKNSKFIFIYKNQQIKYFLNTEKKIKNAISDIKLKLRSVNNLERLSLLEQFKKKDKINHLKINYEDYLIANWKEIKSLDKNLLEIGSHTKTHPHLKDLSTKEDFYKELYESKVKIEKEIGYPVKHLCYPYGSYNKNVIQQAKRFGYLTGLTIIRGLNSLKTDLFQLKRIMGYNNFTLFKANISGLYPFLKKLKV